MSKLRFLFLMLVLALLIAPLKLTGSADQLRGFGADRHEFAIYGNVKIRGTPSGHVTVAVDKSLPFRGVEGDGVWDTVFHFAPKKSKPAYQDINLDLENATLIFTGRRLTVLSTERRILLNLSLERNSEIINVVPYYDDRSRDLPETARIDKGLALGQYQGTMEDVKSLWLCGTEGGTCSVLGKNGDLRPMDNFAIECPSGGTGSTECGIDCGAGQGCNVSCGPGYHACCHCTNGCHCIRN